ncbi:hypothetical protein R69608_07925 [Paraburkholderia nemoris]|nr:hypothetical protein R75777_07775 [Paraburkholderia nemoris]CAE6973188.1 hypothetical protein R69608_07925 [Paraburkholderia nemoris]
MHQRLTGRTGEFVIAILNTVNEMASEPTDALRQEDAELG